MYRRAASFLIITGCVLISSANGQQNVPLTASFGNFYGAGSSGYPTVSVFAHTQGQFSNPQSSSNCKTSYGTVTPPLNITNLAGQGTYSIPIKFVPTALDGSFSGTCTVTYTGSSQFGSQLTYNISFSGDNLVPVSKAGLTYVILGIVYDPPGNASTNGFTNTISAGSTASSAQNFSTMDSITFGGSFLGLSNSVTFSTTQSHGNTTQNTTTYQASSSSQLASVVQAIDHTQDQVYLLIDPSVTLTQTGSAAGYYAFGASLDSTGFTQGQTPPDILNVNIAGLLNPSLISLDLLETQHPSPGTTLPGLKYVCAQPLPDNQCTQQNACGCKAADFAPIVAQDELATVTNQATAPSSIDATRYVYMNSVALQGPAQQGAGPVKTTYALSDSVAGSNTTSNGHTYGVNFTHAWAVPGDNTLGISSTNNFSFMQTTTSGPTNGTAHVGTATLGTSDVGCFEYADVYEDTIYHTFALALSQAPPANCQ